MELEHVLARDLVLTAVGSGYGRDYVQRRHVLSGSCGRTTLTCEKAQNDRLRIFHPDWQGPIETSIKLLGLIHEVRAMRQEDMFNAIYLDRNFLVFIQAGKGSILPTMLTASREWRT